jgi:hypothetical protein
MKYHNRRRKCRISGNGNNQQSKTTRQRKASSPAALINENINEKQWLTQWPGVCKMAANERK